MALVITGAGLVTALGYGLSGSCAGLRAGIAMPRTIDVSVDDGEGGDEPAVGYPAGDVASGFFQSGAWTQLAWWAARDLMDRAPLAGEALAATGLQVLAPAIEPERFLWSLEAIPDALEPFVAAPVRELLGAGAPRASALGSAGGHTGLARSLLQAQEAIEGRRLDRILHTAADTYLDGPSLAWLAAERRLKSPERATGLMPGEAGAALLVESAQAARLRNACVLARIEGVAVAAAPPGPAGETTANGVSRWSPPAAPALGRALAGAIRQVLPAGGAKWRGDLYLDLNGETWKANGWGNALVHLGRVVDLDLCRTYVPAESLGETGAASAAIGVALALWNLDRDGTESAIVCSMGDYGEVAAIRVGRAAPQAVGSSPRSAAR